MVIYPWYKVQSKRSSKQRMKLVVSLMVMNPMGPFESVKKSTLNKKDRPSVPVEV